MHRSGVGSIIKSRLLLIIMLVSMLAPILFGTSTIVHGNQTIRLAVWLQGGRFIYEDGELSGYDVDLMQKIAERNNWSVEYVFVSGMSEALDALKQGRVDLISSIDEHEELKSDCLYSGLSTGWEYCGLIKLESRTDIIYQDVEQISECTIGYAKDFHNHSSALTYLLEKYKGIIIREYTGATQLENALTAGEIDLMLAGANDVISGELLADRFSPREVFFLTSRENTMLISQIDAELANIIMSDSSYLPELQKQYFPMYWREDFTKEELDYIATAPALKVGVPVNRRPISYYDEKEGQYAGIAIELMELMALKSGLSFEYVPFDSIQHVDEVLQKEDYDLAVPAVESSFYNDKELVSTTNTLLLTATTIAVKKGTDVEAIDNLRIGVAREFANLGKYMTKRYPNTTIITYDTPEEVRKAVDRGEVTAILNTLTVWSYLLQDPQYLEYSLVPTISVNIPYCIAVEKGEQSQTLLAILDKTIDQIDDSEKNAVLAKYTTGEVYQSTFKDKLIKNLPVMMVVLFIFGVFLIFYIQKIRYFRSLEETNKKLVEANQAKNEFLSRMSHEIRTPMNAILGLAALGKEDVDDAKQVESSFGKIESSGEFLLGIINDILDMSRIETTAIELHEEFINQREFLESVVTMIMPIARRNKIELVYDFSQIMPVQVKADRLRMQQICINLLNNAVKFSESGSKVEWIATNEQLDDTHIQMKYRIRDYGCGMSEEFQQKLFQPFVQEHNKFTDGHSGSGLGLAIVKNIIEQMGGTIAVSSKQGEGSEFIIKLTREIGGMSPENLAQEQDIKGQQEHEYIMALQGKQVLLVEDNEINREVAVMMLERYGMQVDTAEDGAVAVAKVKDGGENRYDIVLMDIHMPVMNGLAATKAIRLLELKYASTLPIVAMTANTFEEDKRQTMAAGMNEHLAKPINRQQLSQALIKYCVNKEENSLLAQVSSHFSSKNKED